MVVLLLFCQAMCELALPAYMSDIINNGIVALQLNILGERITELSYTELFGSSLTTYTAMTLLTISSITLLTAFWRHYPINQHTREKQAST